MNRFSVESMKNRKGTYCPFPMPSISINNSVFMRLDPSCSATSPPLFAKELEPPRRPRIESISSMKMVLGAWYLASSNRHFINFSLSPRNFETMEDAEMLKNVVLL